jgi:CheY-like chemotaxis protein
LHWLIAEDEADIRNLVSMVCQVWGHTPIAFESGQRVWDWLDKVEAGAIDGPLPEFALMDIRMPGHKGHEVARRIRQTRGLENIPIVLMTAFVLSDDEQDDMLENYGVDLIINKPLPDFNELHRILHQLIEEKQSQ